MRQRFNVFGVTALHPRKRWRTGRALNGLEVDNSGTPLNLLRATNLERAYGKVGDHHIKIWWGYTFHRWGYGFHRVYTMKYARIYEKMVQKDPICPYI